jgi:radical SAM protein with 4Fe4S-binding SPASM domain
MIECALDHSQHSNDHVQQFSRKVSELRIPLSGSIELTHHCNLRCIHCYLGPGEMDHRKHDPEMSTDQVRSVLDEITEAGCLFLLITGGEPLIRKDFPEVYQHAKENGLLVTVFTNGTLITDQILELFADFPPQKVEISLYGVTAATHEKITDVSGSYERSMQNIQKLLDAKIPVGLKTILMTHNQHEYFEIENLAQELGVKFRFDPVITPRFDGDKRPSMLRVSPAEAVEKGFSNSDRHQEWHDFFEKFRSFPATDSLYPCGAGLTNFHIDPYGNLQPCLMTRKYQYKFVNGGFRKWWYEIMPKFREKKIASDHACHGCEKISLCGYCPALFQLENGAEELYSEYICNIGHLRYQILTDGG